MNQIQCTHCLHIRPETEKYCPLCRRKPIDKSGHHIQHPVLKLQVPIAQFDIGKKVFITINRGQGQLDSFFGIVQRETTTHYGVMTDKDERSVEFFPKQSDKVNCTIKV